MRKIGVVLASVALAVGLLLFGTYTTEEMSKAQARAATTDTVQPNIIFILTDDMRKDDLKYMPKTKALLQDTGITFQNAFVSNALCCPSRATIMRGQYSHNNGVWSNSSTDSSSTTSGGWQAYQDNGNEADNVATRLHDAGYNRLVESATHGCREAGGNGYLDDLPERCTQWVARPGRYLRAVGLR